MGPIIIAKGEINLEKDSEHMGVIVGCPHTFGMFDVNIKELKKNNNTILTTKLLNYIMEVYERK